MRVSLLTFLGTLLLKLRILTQLQLAFNITLYCVAIRHFHASLSGPPDISKPRWAPHTVTTTLWVDGTARASLGVLPGQTPGPRGAPRPKFFTPAHTL